MISPKNIIRFWSKVQKHKNCCWIWTGYKRNRDRYGGFGDGEKNWLAHRFSYLLTYGDPGNLCVLHKCDNPQCVRPDHLFLGTRNDNKQDCVRKGRHRGPIHLTTKQIRLIRKLRKYGYTHRQIATKCAISHQTVSNIVNWKIHKTII